MLAAAPAMVLCFMVGFTHGPKPIWVVSHPWSMLAVGVWPHSDAAGVLGAFLQYPVYGYALQAGAWRERGMRATLAVLVLHFCAVVAAVRYVMVTGWW
jgi:hypothetical protein